MPRKLTLIVAVLALAATGAAGTADAKRSCKSKHESKGCKLKKGASYAIALDTGGLSVYSAGSSLSVFAAGAHNTVPKTGACGRVSATVKKSPKVGKSYKFRGTGLSPFARYALSGKVKIKSAKQAKVTGTLTARSKDGTKELCHTDLDVTLKRQT